jgi:hypothetical protein
MAEQGRCARSRPRICWLRFCIQQAVPATWDGNFPFFVAFVQEPAMTWFAFWGALQLAPLMLALLVQKPLPPNQRAVTPIPSSASFPVSRSWIYVHAPERNVR